ncbi:glycerophosphodiester phosphodiesterase [Corynebacterium ulcerans]|uniref:glycerophosphodiester phosphodiesterase n=1 Tax=Corynebacterium ulcerans TaxID=65058 RepID=UPI0018D6CF88|nr:glycerophosphodiester phosphodiesterase [Corynebacterium ulcerans]MBH5296245.1 glycerophosphodiester phosphodiesterase [Corynebacterium ulcerans]MDK8889444.1 glycerophosphodiester phosphodiesterase [Corynebacterium ulcerans]
MQIIAHRGFRSAYPEMSAQAFEKALELPIHGVECDVRLTCDGHVVCHHDRTLLRTAGEKTRISTATLQQLRHVNIGTSDNPQHILTLDELLDIVLAHPDKHLYVETKHPLRYGAMLEESIAMRLRYRGLLAEPRIHIISFSHASISRMRRLAPGIDTIYLRREWEARYNPLDVAPSRPTARGLSIAHAKLRPSLVGHKGKRTYMWTVNEREDMRWALDHGADMIATDYPDRALEVVRGG